MMVCPKDISMAAEKVDLNTKEGMAKNGGQAPQNSAVTQWPSPEETPWTKRYGERLPSWIQTPSLIGVDLKT